MKTIIINASPRKNWNTAQLLKSAQKGAEEAYKLGKELARS
jgi:multimeric flavodoxin WrbA